MTILDRSEREGLYEYFVNARLPADIVYWSNTLRKATGDTLYSGPVTMTDRTYQSLNYLEDLNYYSTVLDCSVNPCVRFVDNDNIWNATNQRAPSDVQYGFAKVMNYFNTVHNRNGFDGSGGPRPTLSVDGSTNLFANNVHYGTGINYAAWTVNGINFGDGDSQNYSPFVSMDILTHEITHGIIHYSSVLDNNGEKGALAESWGDVFAVLVDIYYNTETSNSWKIGEDVYIGGDAIRHVDFPPSAPNQGLTQDDNPDHYSEKYTGSLDEYGVHVNSGIPSKAFYLLAKGGSHPNGGVQMTGIGITDAAKIWFRAMTNLTNGLTTNSLFIDARVATILASDGIFGQTSFQSHQVQVAWGLCGVGEVYAPDPDERLLNGEMEDTENPWVLTAGGSVGYVKKGAAGNYVSYKGHMKLGGINSAAGTIYQTFSIPSGSDVTNVTYWVKVASNDSTVFNNSIVVNDRLIIELRDASTNQFLTEFPTITNADQGAYQFYGPFDINTYINYASLRLDFKVITDSNWGITTFFLDDVSVSSYIYK